MKSAITGSGKRPFFATGTQSCCGYYLLARSSEVAQHWIEMLEDERQVEAGDIAFDPIALQVDHLDDASDGLCARTPG